MTGPGPAIRTRELAALRAAVEAGALKPTPELLGPFIRADDGKGLALILGRGVRPEALVSGQPALVAAAAADAEHCVKALLAAGAKPDGRARGGEAAVVAASRRGNHLILRLLLAAGAKTEQRAAGDGNETALILAAAAGAAQAVKLLLSAGAKVDARDANRRTALIAAVDAQEDRVAAAVVRVLLKGGANPFIKDANGRTAEGLARASGLIVTARLLAAAR